MLSVLVLTESRDFHLGIVRASFRWPPNSFVRQFGHSSNHIVVYIPRQLQAAIDLMWDWVHLPIHREIKRRNTPS
jgi:hypothetical protein